MGKPFHKELEKLNDTYRWALNTTIPNLDDMLQDLLEHPTYVIGSGGSSSACELFALHQQNLGSIARNITPLELQYIKNAIDSKTVTVLISAGGRNSDILAAFDTLISNEPRKILSLCLTIDSPLARKSKAFSVTRILEVENIAGKDGFLATNSLIAYFVIISRIFHIKPEIRNLIPNQDFLAKVGNFVSQLYPDFTLLVLYAGWGKPVAIDLESKFSEAGLGNVLVADYRNFGHGRHNWIDKKKSQTAIISITTPDEKNLADKTLALIPNDIPVFHLSTEYNLSDGSIDLLAKSFYLVEAIGQRKKIDPGRPGVPSYGSKLYHLKSGKINSSTTTSYKAELALQRKFGKINHSLTDGINTLLFQSYEEFVTKIRKAKFHGLLLDYDGTLCSSEERFTAPRKEVTDKLIQFIERGIYLGVITGRGKSVRESLQSVLPEEFWNHVTIGYYNGSQIGLLTDSQLPLKENEDELFQEISSALSNNPIIQKFCKLDLRSGQLTVSIIDKGNTNIIKRILMDYTKNKFRFKVQVLESSHSIDIISAKTSKNNAIEHFRNMFADQKEIGNFLCIGDMGKYPGNDYQLLSNEFSLSVNEVSADPYTCWNLASKGVNCVEATLEYFNAIEFKDNFFKIKFSL